MFTSILCPLNATLKIRIFGKETNRRGKVAENMEVKVLDQICKFNLIVKWDSMNSVRSYCINDMWRKMSSGYLYYLLFPSYVYENVYYYISTRYSVYMNLVRHISYLINQLLRNLESGYSYQFLQFLILRFSTSP